jgi:hypothetical protein
MTLTSLGLGLHTGGAAPVEVDAADGDVPRARGASGWPKRCKLGPCTPVEMQLEKAEVGPTSGPGQVGAFLTSHSRRGRAGC